MTGLTDTQAALIEATFRAEGVTLRLADDDMIRGVPGEPCRCPWALALQRAVWERLTALEEGIGAFGLDIVAYVGPEKANVDIYDRTWEGGRELDEMPAVRMDFTLPVWVQSWIKRLDAAYTACVEQTGPDTFLWTPDDAGGEMPGMPGLPDVPAHLAPGELRPSWLVI